MRKLLYASKGWKRLQKEYIDENCFALHSQKLAAVSLQDVITSEKQSRKKMQKVVK